MAMKTSVACHSMSVCPSSWFLGTQYEAVWHTVPQLELHEALGVVTGVTVVILTWDLNSSYFMAVVKHVCGRPEGCCLPVLLGKRPGGRVWRKFWVYLTVLLFRQDGDSGGPDFEPYGTEQQENIKEIVEVVTLELRHWRGGLLDLGLSRKFRISSIHVNSFCLRPRICI